ncbi:tetratricopeptide repeat protein [Azospirillum rugosum]|uniref:Tetratricopeptide repeat-containing protein n=1 Tax=Azospirillum rugosum TaxID=416170 RepID=A0ABS4SEJ2_9PROT|nr:tetratricopeptide repeat protein [Azospirillum rugosum]MBP2290994.1 hypothetical protein [Azospirillum rugosum]MDQ0524942.1 hypothetical protein [Azospirillum rugosum]
MFTVDRTALIQWADRHESWFGLPELVRRLILATATLTELRMPAGDGVQRPGWDGRVHATTGNAWVPEGWSAWEIGTNKVEWIEDKADRDYRKRTDDSLGLDKAQTTFVFVTPRKWDDKLKWMAKRKAEGVWRDVKVYDADDLENWSVLAPRVSRWFAAEILRLPQARADWNEPRIVWKPAAALRYDAGPLAWLSWDARLTELRGRDAEFQELLSWARGDGGVRFRFLVGEGGSGKTRLAHEVAAQLAEDPSWAAGRVPADQPLPVDAGIKGCFLIVDYPEERRDEIAKRLAELAEEAEDAHRTVRVLLLSRRGEEYWESLVQDARASAHQDRAIHLPDAIAPDDAWDVFRLAVPRVPSPPGTPVPQPVDKDAFLHWFTGMPTNQRPLLVAAAAVQSVMDGGRSVLTLTAAELIDSLADRELSRLRRLADKHRFQKEALARLAALAAVRGALDETLIRGLAVQGLDLGLGDPETVVDRIRETGVLDESCEWQAPVPDIVASVLIVKVLGQRPKQAPEWLWAIVSGQEEASIQRAARLAYDAEVTLGRLEHRLSRWLATMLKGRSERCAPLDAWASDRMQGGMMPAVAAVVSMTLATKAQSDEEKAAHLNSGSNHLSGAGDGTGALAAIQEAVDLYRRLAKANPARFEADLALVLNNLSSELSEAGDRPGALNAIQEAVELCRRLTKANPVRFEPNLAWALNNLSNRLSEAGDGPGALAAIQKAVDLHRRLAKANPARFEADLALVLNNLSSELLDAGDRPGALNAIQEAVDLHRRLVKTNPALFELDLAGSLHKLSHRLSEASDGSGALAAIQKAVDLYRRLAKANPARFEPDLAGSLNSLSNRLSEAGDGPGALAAIQQAVDLCRRLAKANPARFEPDLAGSLNNLSNRLSEAGDEPGALAAIQQAVELYRRLAKANPACLEPDLASSLYNHSLRLSEAGDRPGALAAIKEAVGIRRRLAKANPARFEPDLASSLNNLSFSLSDAGDGPGALDAIKEAVGLYWRQAKANPLYFAHELANSLAMWARWMAKFGTLEDAIAIMNEAIDLNEPFAKAYPDELPARRHRRMLADLEAFKRDAGDG